MDQGYTIELREGCVYLAIEGRFEMPAGGKAASRFEQILATVETTQLVADLSGLTGYDRETREEWTRVIRENRSKLTRIVFVGVKNPLIRMAAAAVALASGVVMSFEE